MKKMLAVLVSATLSTAAIADTKSGYFVGGFVEKNFVDSDKDTDARYDFINNGEGLGLEFGYLYNSKWGGRIEWSNLSFDNALGGSDVKGDRYGIDLLYRFKEQGDIYGILGLKQLEAGNGHTALNLGLGLNRMTSERLAIFAEGTGYAGLDKSFVDFGVKLGLRYHFEPMAKMQPAAIQPVQKVLDSDNDGVLDHMDKCPNTGMSQKVDAQGCTVVAAVVAPAPMDNTDADNDGVVDRLDRCLNTEANAKVDDQGCLVVEVVAPAPDVDSDKDGVVDRLDHCPNTGAEYLVDQNGCMIYEDKQVSINLNVQFANNSSQVPQEALPDIRRIAQFMNRYTDTSVEIAGHSSAGGNDAYNMKLSSRRAKAVADILVNDFAVPSERVTYKGYGETQLLDSSNTPEADLKNRRIEAVISGEERRAKLR